MTPIVVLGEPDRVRGYRMTGATVMEVAGPAEAAAAAWDDLPPDTALVVLTRAVAAVVRDRLAERPRLVWAVIP